MAMLRQDVSVTKLSQLFDGLSLRERIITISSCLLLLYFLWYLLVGSHLLKAKEHIVSERVFLLGQYKVQDADLQFDDYSEELLRLTEKLKLLKGEVDKLNADMANYLAIIPQPDDLMNIVKSLLDENPKITVEEMLVLPSSLVMNNHIGETKDNHFTFIKHPVKIQFISDYVNTLDYLNRLEKLEWKVFIESVSYQVVKHPVAKVEVLLYVLSAGEADV